MADYKDKLAEIVLKRGTILFSEELFRQTVGHPKHFVIIGEDDEGYKGYFYINSNIHECIKHKEEQIKLQYVVRNEDYPFLKYYSYVNCATLMNFPKQVLKDCIIKNTIKIEGELNKYDLDSILKCVRESDIYSPKEKKTYFK